MQPWMESVTIDMLPAPHRKLAEAVGIQATLELCEAFGGTTISVPKNDKVYNLTVRDRQIRRRYLLGARAAQLALQYSLSESTILRITKGTQPEQISLLGGDGG